MRHFLANIMRYLLNMDKTKIRSVLLKIDRIKLLSLKKLNSHWEIVRDKVKELRLYVFK